MKKIVFLLTLAAALRVHAQYAGLVMYPVPLSTNIVAAATTNSTIRGTIYAGRGLDVAIQPIFQLDGTGTSAVVFNFDESLDNVNWATNTRSISVTASGTNVVTSLSDFTIASGFLRLSSVQNPNAQNITNLVIKTSQKGAR
jgi:hypothetical protein